MSGAGAAEEGCVYVGVRGAGAGPGGVRLRLEGALQRTVTTLKAETAARAQLTAADLEAIHHGKILKDEATLQESGVKNGDMIHIVKKKSETPAEPPQTFSDTDLQQIVTSLRTFGCTPNAPGWIRAMQMLNEESTMDQILDAVPALNDDCVSISMLHEIELLAALGATLNTMRRGAVARPPLMAALRELTRLVRSQPGNPNTDTNAPTSGFAYSLEALSEDEDGDEEDEEVGGTGRVNAITQDQLSAALQAAARAVATDMSSSREDDLLRFLQNSGESSRGTTPALDTTSTSATPAAAGGSRSLITPSMFSDAISDAMNRASADYSAPAGTPMDQSTTASSSQSPGAEDYSSQLQHMHEVGLLDDAVNLRALLICAGDVNAAINFVFTSMEE